jgi:BRCT domain type II-containing protein
MWAFIYLIVYLFICTQVSLSEVRELIIAAKQWASADTTSVSSCRLGRADRDERSAKGHCASRVSDKITTSARCSVMETFPRLTGL